MQEQKLSLWAALLININVIFGTGIFINTVNLAQITGFFGFASYALVALLLLPLILALTTLLRLYPIGGFYSFAHTALGPLAAFCSTWAYFTGKLASAALLIHVFSQLIQTIVTPLQAINILAIDAFTIMLFMWLNWYNVQTGTKITYTFICLKLIPIVTALASSLYLISRWSIPTTTFLYSNIPATVPLVLYAFVGFEAACALSRKIKNPEENAWKVLLYSFLFALTITITYQFFIFLAIGPELMNQQSFLDVFPLLMHTLVGTTTYSVYVVQLLHIVAASAALGGAYGIILSNAWNLYTLAEKNTIPFAATFVQQNRFHIPFNCVLIEGLLCLVYLLLTGGNQVDLQQLSALGCTIAFSMSALSLLVLQRTNNTTTTYPLIAWLAVGSCVMFLVTFVRNFLLLQTGNYIFISLAILACGIALYGYKNKLQAA